MTKAVKKRQRRRYLRIPFSENIIFQHGNKESSEGRLKDLSIGGAFLLTNLELGVGQDILLYLPLKMGSQTRLCKVHGNTVHKTSVNRGTSEETLGYGIHFDDATAKATKEMLFSYIKRCSEGDSPILIHQKVEKRAAPRPRPIPRKVRKSAKAKTSFPKASIAVGLFGVILLALGTQFAIKTRWNSKLKQYVPMENVSVQDDTLRAQVSDSWLNSRSHETKEEELRALANELRKKQIYGVILTDSAGRIVIRVLKNPANRDEPMIQILE